MPGGGVKGVEAESPLSRFFFFFFSLSFFFFFLRSPDRVLSSGSTVSGLAPTGVDGVGGATALATDTVTMLGLFSGTRFATFVSPKELSTNFPSDPPPWTDVRDFILVISTSLASGK